MDAITLGNGALTLRFDAERFGLRSVDNHLTGERYAVDDGGFSLATSYGTLTVDDAEVAAHDVSDEAVVVDYRVGALAVRVTWTLKADAHFAEMVLEAKADADWQWMSVTAARWRVSGAALTPYHHLKNVTYFGRTARGGCFMGVESPFDASVLEGDALTLGHSVSMKVSAGEVLDAEPVYVGVYARGGDDEAEASGELPRPSEGAAMRAMVQAVVGGPRHGLVASALGWHSEMYRETYTDEELEKDLRGLELIADCGIDWMGEGHVWGGQFLEVSSLIDPQSFTLGEHLRRFLDHAKKLGIKVLLWSSMNHAHPWRRKVATPFRPDKPQWLFMPGGMVHHETMPDGSVQETRNVEVNCVGNTPFLEWLTKLHLTVMERCGYPGWTIDGHFIGLSYSGRFNIPSPCPSEAHDHLPGDAQFACMRALRKLIAAVRRAKPDVCIQQYRPTMDLGVWNCRDTDGLFTVFESQSLEVLPGLSERSPHMAIGDKVRAWSRIRVHQHFLPHYMDMSLLFPLPLSEGYAQARAWSNDGLDYTLLSALSCSPKMLFYLPTRGGVDAEGRATIRKWLDWGRANERYLMVREDLPALPGKDVVDGSLHLIDGEGFVFLFNPNDEALAVALPLDGAHVEQVFPEGGAFDGTVAARTAVLLRVDKS